GSRSSQRRQAGEGFDSLQEEDRFHARNHSSQFQGRKQFRPHPSRMNNHFQQQEHRQQWVQHPQRTQHSFFSHGQRQQNPFQQAGSSYDNQGGDRGFIPQIDR
ncbi:unnamed protein product, partial [Laminaria digitata]